jgi:hypothetical protein
MAGAQVALVMLCVVDWDDVRRQIKS